jgi:hypothetical protein
MFINIPVTVLIDSITFIICSNGGSRFASRLNHSISADRYPCGSAKTFATLNHLRHKVLIHQPIAVIIYAITGMISGAPVTRLTGVRQGPVRTNQITGLFALPSAAGGHYTAIEMLIGLSIAILIDAVAVVISSSSGQCITNIFFRPIHTGCGSRGLTHSLSAGGKPGNEVLIHLTVTIVIYPIACGVLNPGKTGNTGV